ncbi:hypothetical protein Heshes_19350 [Alicyclobacillus hesperidum]|uniref:Uncharacterized protein n=1 Tax=Alicyclobacillus hesperidum TaxID=89784 RepID=A0AA37TXT9_9BACL|nr:hypothetical protein Heshes_19350 [Alicyclobacillus hesperidum]
MFYEDHCFAPLNLRPNADLCFWSAPRQEAAEQAPAPIARVQASSPTFAFVSFSPQGVSNSSGYTSLPLRCSYIVWRSP